MSSVERRKGTAGGGEWGGLLRGRGMRKQRTVGKAGGSVRSVRWEVKEKAERMKRNSEVNEEGGPWGMG